MSGSCVLQNPGDVEEHGPPCIIKSKASAGRRKWLARKPRDEQFETWQRGRFDRRDVAEGGVVEVSFISLDGPLVDFGIAHTLELDAEGIACHTHAQLKAPYTREQREVPHSVCQRLPSDRVWSMSEDQQHDDLEQDPIFQSWAGRIRRDLIPMLEDSQATISLVPSRGHDVKFAVELGLSIMMEKPIVAVVTPGMHIPRGLAKVADEIVEVDWNADMDKAHASIDAAFQRIQDRDDL